MPNGHRRIIREDHNELLAVACAAESRPVRGFGSGGRVRPDVEACARLNQKFGAPHRFYPHFIGDGTPATFYETNWGPTGSLCEDRRPGRGAGGFSRGGRGGTDFASRYFDAVTGAAPAG